MWVEKIEKRTQKSKTFYDADTNKYQTELTIHDKHFKNETDNWIDVDENFEDGGIHSKKCDKTRHAIHIANGGARRWYPRRNITTEYVDITNIQYYTNQWRNLNLPTPAWTNNKTEWDMTNLYASITNTWRRIKADFTLKNSSAYTRLRFAVSFVGLTYNATTGELTSTTDGLVWGTIDKPTAKDANEVDVPVTQVYSGGYIEWSVDTTGATFPIYVDPTFTDGYGGDVNSAYDTYLDYTDPDTIKGALTYITSETDNARALLRFDLSSIAAESTCTTATLTLVDDDCKDATHYIYLLSVANRDWTEAGATWNHKIHTTDHWAGSVGCNTETTDYLATAIGSFSTLLANADGTSYTCDLTNTTVEGLFGGNIDLLIKGSPSGNNWFFSSDRATTGYRPKLVVEYTEGTSAIEGSTSWGQATGAQEGNVRTFSGNWIGNGFVSGSGNYEKMYLSSTAYMESEVVNTGANSIDLYQNKYSGGDTGVLKYRSGSSVVDCQASAWQTYSGSFTSSGYTQVRVEGS
jgi:hypothetical protein